MKIFKKLKEFKKNHKTRFWIVIILVAILVLKHTLFNNKKVKYDTVLVTKGKLVETISTTGKVRASEFANLTFQTGGRLAFVNVDEGDSVKKGQAIAGLDTVILNAAYQQALNNYRNYQAIAESTLDSLKGHENDETYSQKATRTTAEVARDNAYDAVKATRQNLNYATIFAPFNGIMAEVTPTSPGINVTPSSVSFVIVNPDTLYFNSEISETDLSKIKIGQKVIINLDSYPDEKIDGEVENVGIVAFTSTSGGNAYSLKISLPKTNQKYRVGMGGDAQIVIDKFENILKIPTSAIVYENNKNYVWTLGSNNELSKKEIQIGISTDDETQIRAGVDDGARIILIPSSKFKEGEKIETRN